VSFDQQASDHRAPLPCAAAVAARDFYRRTFAEPALDVNGIQTGSPVLQPVRSSRGPSAIHQTATSTAHGPMR